MSFNNLVALYRWHLMPKVVDGLSRATREYARMYKNKLYVTQLVSPTSNERGERITFGISYKGEFIRIKPSIDIPQRHLYFVSSNRRFSKEITEAPDPYISTWVAIPLEMPEHERLVRQTIEETRWDICTDAFEQEIPEFNFEPIVPGTMVGEERKSVQSLEHAGALVVVLEAKIKDPLVSKK